jgi:hypothetical protein
MTENFEKYSLERNIIDIERLAIFIFDYETGGRILTPAGSIEGWIGAWFPEQLKDTYRAKALHILEWLSENGERAKLQATNTSW